MPLAALPFLLIPYDSLTYMVGLDPGETSQTLPATAVFSLFYLLWRRSRLQSSLTGALVLRNLVIAAACIVLATLGNIVAETFPMAGVDDSLRMSTAVRQGISLGLGFSSFLMFQDALLRVGWQRACRWIILGALPSLALCCLQIAQGSFRIHGFSSEPSLLGDMLVLAFLPACFYARLTLRRRFLLIATGAAALLACFSGTGIIKASVALLSFSVARGKTVQGLIVVACALSLTYAILSLYPDNYVFMLIGLFQAFLDSGKLVGGSFIDRFFGFAGPVSMLGGPHGWLGFGLGGDTVYFDRIFDADTAAAIRHEKNVIASISSLQAKMLLYGGVIGYAFYLSAWWRSWRVTARTHPAKFMIPTVFVASVFSLGPFFLPYIWFWLAVGATANSGRPVLAAVNLPLAHHGRVGANE